MFPGWGMGRTARSCGLPLQALPEPHSVDWGARSSSLPLSLVLTSKQGRNLLPTSQTGKLRPQERRDLNKVIRIGTELVPKPWAPGAKFSLSSPPQQLLPSPELSWLQGQMGRRAKLWREEKRPLITERYESNATTHPSRTRHLSADLLTL